MKKLFTSFALLCATFVTLQAQDCVFQYKNSPLEDGATVTIYPEEDVWGDMVCDTNPAGSSDGLYLLNKTSHELTVDASIDIQTNTLGAENIQWCMGADCMNITGTSKSKTGIKLKANDKMMTKFDCGVTKEGEMLTKLSVKSGSKTYTVNIRFVNGESHVAGVEASVVPVAYYTLDGRQVGQRPRGLCLVKFSDGRVRKVVGK